MDAAGVPCELVRMDVERSRLPDEAHGARAAGPLLAGDVAEAEDRGRLRVGALSGGLPPAPGARGTERLAARRVARRWAAAACLPPRWKRECFGLSAGSFHSPWLWCGSAARFTRTRLNPRRHRA